MLSAQSEAAEGDSPGCATSSPLEPTGSSTASALEGNTDRSVPPAELKAQDTLSKGLVVAMAAKTSAEGGDCGRPSAAAVDASDPQDLSQTPESENLSSGSPEL